MVPDGYFDLAAEMKDMPYDELQVDVSAEDIVQIPYTSGTESKPKGAMLSHRALMSQYHSCIFDGQYDTYDVSLHALPCSTAPSFTASSCRICTSERRTSSCTRRMPWR